MLKYVLNWGDGTSEPILDKKMTVELSECERNAEFYYHGTSKKYLVEQTDENGRFMPEYKTPYPEPIFVAVEYFVSEGYAQNQTVRWRSGDKYSLVPVVLKINGDKVRDRVYVHPQIDDICVDYLDKGEFEVLELRVDKKILAMH